MELFQSTSDNGILTLTMSGRLDADTTAAFGDMLNGCIDRGERRIILDLSGVDYVSSVGLRALIVAAKRLGGLSGKIVLCAPQDRILKLLEIAGFTSIFTITSTRDEATERLR
jgi:anti-anti-sigma factor